MTSATAYSMPVSRAATPTSTPLLFWRLLRARGELSGLRWADVDMKRGTLTFHQTKNGERRAVPLTGQALTLMQQHAKVRHLNSQLVFPDTTGTRPLGMRDAFEAAVERASISDFRFHDLRHTFASYLAMNG